MVTKTFLLSNPCDSSDSSDNSDSWDSSDISDSSESSDRSDSSDGINQKRFFFNTFLSHVLFCFFQIKFTKKPKTQIVMKLNSKLKKTQTVKKSNCDKTQVVTKLKFGTKVKLRQIVKGKKINVTKIKL